MNKIPNLFSLCNLVCGCIAIVYVLQTGIIISADDSGQSIIEMPEKIYMASLFIGIAALIDFCDGFIARLLNAQSDKGKQIDSLADVVSFGVAPGMIIYQFLRLSFAQQPGGLDVSIAWLLPAFVIPCAGAYRLARFNIDTTICHGFKGLPIPAAGLLIASFPLIYWHTTETWLINLLLNEVFWYALIAVISYLMISTLPMLSLKFAHPGFKQFLPFIIILFVALVSAVMVGWLAVPLSFIAYIIISLMIANRSTTEVPAHADAI